MPKPLGFGLGLFPGRVGGGGVAGGSFSPATWEIAYNDTVTTSAANGATVSGLPFGLIGNVSGGVLTVEGVPQ